MTLSDLNSFKLRNFRLNAILWKKKMSITFFKMYTEYLFPETKTRWNEGGGRILLGDSKAAGRSGSTVVEFGFNLDLLLYAQCVVSSDLRGIFRNVSTAQIGA